jgi:hypothetical protein
MLLFAEKTPWATLLPDDLRTLAPGRSPTSSSRRSPADPHLLNGFVAGPIFEFDG